MTKICDLPDPILQEDILTRLDSKDSIRTSVLSKRWVDQWKDISKLELEELEPERRQKFIDFVGRLLMVYNLSRLKKLSLSFEVGEDAPRVNEWLHAFIKPNIIQELNLNLERVQEPVVFPEDLFTSETLTKFQLNMQHVLNLPSSVRLQNLRTLAFKNVKFPVISSTQRLLSGCPLLEELTLIDCNWMNNLPSVCLDFPLLNKFVVREWKDDYDNAANGQNAAIYCRIIFRGTQLKTFSYDGDLINDYFLYGTSSVTDAAVEVQLPDSNRSTGNFVCKLLNALFKAEKLSITDYAAEALCGNPFYIMHLPQFVHMVELRVVSGSGSPADLSCVGLVTILRNSPLLQAVEFDSGVTLPQNGANIIIGVLPSCFGTHLKTITIHDFSGKEGELNAIRFLLETASVLDALCINHNTFVFDAPGGPERLEELYMEIESFPCASDDCDIVLE
ncbi:Leucine-rich repeat domain superfamily [Sesbania bispinosa]|nr:Leucine-rich repeat domain superfamily [Sesbania bispinosa]